MTDTRTIVRSGVETVLTRAAQNPSLAIQPRDIEQLTGELENALVAITSGKPWWRSRTIWGVLVAAVSSTAKPFIGELPVDTAQIADALTSAGMLVGFGLTIYGRFAARRPIGKVD